MNDFKLDKHPKIKPGFIIPENYFENFENNILSKFPQNDIRIIQMKSNERSWIYTAAAILILALAIPSLNRIIPKIDENNVAIENYLAYTDISDENLVELLSVKDIQQINVDNTIEDKTIEDALSSNSNLENYIID